MVPLATWNDADGEPGLGSICPIALRTQAPAVTKPSDQLRFQRIMHHPPPTYRHQPFPLPECRSNEQSSRLVSPRLAAVSRIYLSAYLSTHPPSPSSPHPSSIHQFFVV